VQVPSRHPSLTTAGRAAIRPTAVAALAGLVVGACTVALAIRALVAERQTVDDVFIFLRYARNLATGARYAFDPAGLTTAGARVEGTSSVAWTLVLAGAWRAGARGLGAAKAISLGLGLLVPATCALAVRQGLAAGGRLRPLLVALPAVALAFDADFATWAVSGMDTSLWTLACVGCVALAGRPSAAAVLLGLLAWVRPEGPLFAAAGVLALARDRRSLARLALLAAVPIAVLTVLREAYFRELVPNTFWAKMNAVDGKDYTGLGYVASALGRRPLLLLVVPAAALAASHRGDRSPAIRVALGLLAASLAFALLAGGDWMPDRRLLVVALPLAAVVAPLALPRPGALLATLAGVALAAEALLTCDHALDQTWREHEWLDERVTRWRPSARPFVDPYPLDWMPTHLLHELAPYVAPRDVVAHVDVGELPYVMGDVGFLDGFGLVDREAGRLAFSPRDAGLRADAREAFFAASPAAAIVVVDEATGRPFSPAQDAALEDGRFAAGWRELSRVPTWGGHPCVTYVRRGAVAVPEAVAAAREHAWLAAVPDVR
jgi:hypothetical protein